MNAKRSPFNKMLEEAHVWLHDLTERMGSEDRQAAYHAYRGVLFALRDRLPLSEAFGLAAQLPTLLRGVYFDGYSPAGKPEKYGYDEFVARVAHELQLAGGRSPEPTIQAVAAVME